MLGMHWVIEAVVPAFGKSLVSGCVSGKPFFFDVGWASIFRLVVLDLDFFGFFFGSRQGNPRNFLEPRKFLRS